MKYFTPLLVLFTHSLCAQETVKDTTHPKELQEVIVIGKKSPAF